jgi:hypothetical protein
MHHKTVLPRRNTLVVAIALAAALSFPDPVAAAQTELLSLRGLQIGKNQYIDRFHIQTWDVQILAVCHIPRYLAHQCW